MRCVILCILLTGCSLARVDVPPQAGYAQVTIARQADGKPAIYVFDIDSKHHFRTQPLEQETSLALSSLTFKPGTYSLEIECERPGAGVVVDGGIDFEVSVQADTIYVLDCSPTKNAEYGYPENNFALSKLQPNYSLKRTAASGGGVN